MSIRDFDRLQHYSNRALLWIKLYVDLLDDYEFQQLADNTKFHLIGLMLLAARMGNRLPNNSDYLSRQIGANTSIDLDTLLLNRFLVPAKRKQEKGQLASILLASSEKVASPEQTKQRAGGEYKDHTTSEHKGPIPVVVDVFKSRHPPETIMLYVEDCRKRGQAIHSPQGLANTLRKSGEADGLIDVLIQRKNAPPPPQADPLCDSCHGTGSEVVEGKGARICTVCLPSSAECPEPGRWPRPRSQKTSTED